jgi:hypothetical protein
MCWTLNHQNIIEIPQGHISLSISPFLVIYANTTTSNQKKCNINAIEDQIVFDYNLAYLDRSVNQILFPISKSNTLVWENQEIFQWKN